MTLAQHPETTEAGRRCATCAASLAPDASWCGQCFSAVTEARGSRAVDDVHPDDATDLDLEALLAVPDFLRKPKKGRGDSAARAGLRGKDFGIGAIVVLTVLLTTVFTLLLVDRERASVEDETSPGGPLIGVPVGEPPRS